MAVENPNLNRSTREPVDEQVPISPTLSSNSLLEGPLSTTPPPPQAAAAVDVSPSVQGAAHADGGPAPPSPSDAQQVPPPREAALVEDAEPDAGCVEHAVSAHVSDNSTAEGAQHGLDSAAPLWAESAQEAVDEHPVVSPTLPARLLVEDPLSMVSPTPDTAAAVDDLTVQDAAVTDGCPTPPSPSGALQAPLSGVDAPVEDTGQGSECVQHSVSATTPENSRAEGAQQGSDSAAPVLTDETRAQDPAVDV